MEVSINKKHKLEREKLKKIKVIEPKESFKNSPTNSVVSLVCAIIPIVLLFLYR